MMLLCSWWRWWRWLFISCYIALMIKHNLLFILKYIPLCMLWPLVFDILLVHHSAVTLVASLCDTGVSPLKNSLSWKLEPMPCKRSHTTITATKSMTRNISCTDCAKRRIVPSQTLRAEWPKSGVSVANARTLQLACKHTRQIFCPAWSCKRSYSLLTTTENC